MKNKMNINTFIAEYAIIIIFIVLFAAMSIFAPNCQCVKAGIYQWNLRYWHDVCHPDRGYRPIGRGYHWGKRRPDSNDDDKQC